MEHSIAPSSSEFIPLRRNYLQHTESTRNPYDGLRFWSAATHGIGAILSVFATVALLIQVTRTGNDPWKMVSFLIYGISMICLYTASTLYHSVNISVRGRISLRKFDHISIYFLIAGTYTPVCLTALRGPWGWSILGIIWALSISGIFMCLFWINCPRLISTAIYISMGWLAMLAIWPLWEAIGITGIAWLLGGGILYTIGGVLYALKWPGKDNIHFGCHEIFHLFILLGSTVHFLMIFLIILPI